MGKPIIRREYYLLLYSSCNTVVTGTQWKGTFPLCVFGEGWSPVHFICCWLTDWVLSQRKERDTLAYSFGESKQAHMVKSPCLKLISPFGPLSQAGPTDLWQPWVPVLLLPFFLLAVFWGPIKCLQPFQPVKHERQQPVLHDFFKPSGNASLSVGVSEAFQRDPFQ